MLQRNQADFDNYRRRNASIRSDSLEEGRRECIKELLPVLDNFDRAMIAAVNHKGDSDSTGAVTGNILGAVVGYDAIPEFFKTDLELHDVILHVADDIWRGETTKFERK